MPDSIRHDRREAWAEAHTINRLRDAEAFRGAVNTLLGTIGTLTFPVDYVEGHDQAEIVALLKEWAGFSRARVEEIAADDVLAIVNEGLL